MEMEDPAPIIKSEARSGKMAPISENLKFKFMNYGDSVLQKMNMLREQNKFCDVTIQLNNITFHGHKVVFAACSPFLRDQFLLNDSREVEVSILQSSEVGQQLLLSCYTGVLEFPVNELVNYLTAASFLQMGHVVEQCAEAVSQYFVPKSEEGEKEQRVEQNSMPEENQEASQQKEKVLQPVHDSGEVKADNDHVSKTSKCKDSSGNKKMHAVKVESYDSDDLFRVQNPSPEISLSLINSAVEITKSYLQAYSEDSATESEVLNGDSYMLAANEIQFQGVDPTSDFAALEGCPLTAHRNTSEIRTGNVGLQDGILEKPYNCPKCEKTFQHLGNFISHVKEHKLFLCLRCGKTFSQKSNLTRHIRVHTGFKPYQCTVCKRSFTQKATLQDHMNLHSGIKPHKCNYCEMHFAHRPGLRRHLKEVHKKSSTENNNEEIEEITVDFD